MNKALTTEALMRVTWVLSHEPSWKPFELLMTRHVAPLSERLGFFVGRMNKRDRELFIEAALWEAWAQRDQLRQRTGSLLAWWTACAKEVMLKRESWMFHYSTHSVAIRSVDFVKTIQ